MKLFVIGGVDYTTHITVPSYTVNQIDQYIEWQDATYKNHRYKARSTVSGNFTIYFDDVNEYLEFLGLVDKNRNSLGYIPDVELYCNNKDAVVKADVFLDMNPANDLPYFGTKSHSGYQITIQER